MEHKTNRTFICCVVFMDIVEYSKLPMNEQMQLKTRFNGILAEATKGVAVNDRIILDTGDGAALSFLGDPEDALFVALSIRDATIGKDSLAKPCLSVRIGINLGPVKLVQDINGQRNLIGDGINVAQRIMSFAEPGQVLVSRSYFEVISRVSQEYAKLFRYEGSRADKHVREHQVYSVCPEEKEEAFLPASPDQRTGEGNKETTGDGVSTSAAYIDAGGQSGKTVTKDGPPLRTFQPSFWKRISGNWNIQGSNWNALRNNRKRLYVAAATIIIVVGVTGIVWKKGGAPAKDPGTSPSPTLVAAPEETMSAETPWKPEKVEIPTQVYDDQKKTEMATTPDKAALSATVLLGISPWGEVYVDGHKKGVSPPLNTLQLAPGKHAIEIWNTTFPPYQQTINLRPGQKIKIKHKFG